MKTPAILTASHTLIVFDRDGRSIGEWKFAFPYGDSNAAIEPLQKLRTEYVGVTLSSFGIAAVSADMPTDNPWYRKNAIQVTRESLAGLE